MNDKFVSIKWEEYQEWYHRIPSAVNFFEPDSVFKVVGHDDERQVTHVQEWTADRTEYRLVGASIPDRFIVPLED